MKNILVSLFCGCLGAMIFVLINNHFYSRPIAVVNLTEIIGEHIQAQSERNLTDDQRNEHVREFSFTIERLIQEIAEKERVTLLTAPAVISDVPDYTQYLKDYLKDEMEQKFDRDSHSTRR